MGNVRCLSALVMAAGFLGAPLSSIAQETSRIAQGADVEVLPEPKQHIQLRPGFSQEIVLKRAFSRAEVADPSVVDIQPTTDRQVTLVAGKAGSTIIRFRDAKGGLISQIVAVVWPPQSKKLLSTFEDIPGRVKVYRAPDRTGFYRCNDIGCELVAEHQVTEPSPSERAQRPANNTDESTEPDKSEASSPAKP